MKRFFINDWGIDIISDEDYDIRPRKHVIERRLKETKNSLETAKRIRDMALDSYTKRIQELEKKIEELEKQLNETS